MRRVFVGALLCLTAPLASWAEKLPPAVTAADNPVREGQALIKEKKFPEALAKFGEAQGATAGISQPTLKLFYQVTARLGSATALDGMQRYDAALEHCDWANQTVATPAARQLPDALSAAVHHICGVILYHQKRTDEAKAFFEQAAKEGDKTAADWQKVVSAPPPLPTKPEDMVARADEDAQSGKLIEALQLYVMALQHFDALGDKTAQVMERALAVALRLDPPPLIPKGADERLKAADAALRAGSPADLDSAGNLLRTSVIQVPWWSDGWKRLGDVEEKRGDLKAARGALRFYLKTNPKAPDQSAIEQRIASLSQQIESGAASSPLADAADTPATATPTPTPVAVADISGNWSTTDGRIIAVKQNGNQVSWSSCCKPGHEDLVVTVSGTFDGTTLNGTYHYREGQAEGSGAASYTLNGDRLEGVWNSPDGKTYNSALIRHPGEAPGNLGGKWTTAIGRTVALTQTGDQVSWRTCCRQAHPNWTADITATFDGKNLVGTYHWRDGDQQGNGTVMYALNGNQLEGAFERPGKEPYHSVLTRQADGSISGKWATASGDTLTLTQKGNDVTGTNCCRPGHPNYTGDVSGSFDGKNFVGVLHYRDGDAQGMGTFIYALNDTGQLEGSFKLTGGEETKTVLTRQ